jgi:outer membrane lipoprotein
MQSRCWLTVVLFVISGCVTTPEPLRGEFAVLTPQTAQTQNAAGQRVRWGGEIIKATPGPNETCFELLGHALDDNGRPVRGDKTQGRFIACAPGFYDPAVYIEDRELTVTGTLSDTVTDKIGNYDYRYPRVAAQTVYLWPKHIQVYPAPLGYYDPFYDPFFSPFGYRHWPYYW